MMHLQAPSFVLDASKVMDLFPFTIRAMVLQLCFSYVSELREQNDTLKLYVDHLVARVMEECPEALCASAASAAVALATR